MMPTPGQTYESATNEFFSIHVQSIDDDGFIIVTYPDESRPAPDYLDAEQWQVLSTELQLSPRTDLA